MSGPAGPRVAVLISADTEWLVIRGHFAACDPEESPFGHWFVAELDVGERLEPVLFFHGGWGKIAAAGSTQYVIDCWSPALLVNLGTCGGFEGEIEKGTVILAERTLVYDIVEQMGDHDEHIAHYETELDLSWLDGEYPQDVVRSLLVSGDRDLLPEDVPRLREQFGAVAGDWESGAIAWVAARNETRCLILRGVTDLVGEGGGEAYGNLELYAQNALSVLDSLLSSLPDWIGKLPTVH